MYVIMKVRVGRRCEFQEELPRVVNKSGKPRLTASECEAHTENTVCGDMAVRQSSAIPVLLMRSPVLHFVDDNGRRCVSRQDVHDTIGNATLANESFHLHTTRRLGEEA